MNTIRSLSFSLSLALMVSLPSQSLAADSVKSLTKAGKYEKAYKLGKTQLVKKAGSPNFDYWFGMAALQSGHASEASFAFERVLMFDPNNHAALLRLGQAQAEMGAQLRAKKTMTDLLARNPKKAIAKQARRTLSDVSNGVQGRKEKSYTTAYVEVSGGSDSNINSATDVEFHDLVGATLQVSGTALETSDSYGRLAAGLATKRAGKGRFWFGGFSGYEHKNAKYSDFDTRGMKAWGGMGFRSGKHRFTFPIRYQTLALGGDEYLNYVAGQVKWLRYVGSRYAFGSSLEYGQYTYDLLDRDSTNTLLDFSWYRYATKRSRTKMSFGVYVGNETVDSAANDYLTHNFTGVIFTANYRFRKNHVPYLTVRTQKNDYDGNPIGFTEARDELYTYVNLGWKWNMKKDTSIKLEGIYTNNDSNLDLYAYDRTQIRMGLRYTYR